MNATQQMLLAPAPVGLLTEADSGSGSWHGAHGMAPLDSCTRAWHGVFGTAAALYLGGVLLFALMVCCEPRYATR